MRRTGKVFDVPATGSAGKVWAGMTKESAVMNGSVGGSVDQAVAANGAGAPLSRCCRRKNEA
ncbi:MAG: hypothetical protein EKK40_11715 [Bradyrhizobiaceae bacterium]|nr:MAG: hypothetical protein EKK40_11715 [Bradyrhizobiaceae bacterium]